MVGAPVSAAFDLPTQPGGARIDHAENAFCTFSFPRLDQRLDDLIRGGMSWSMGNQIGYHTGDAHEGAEQLPRFDAMAQRLAKIGGYNSNIPYSGSYGILAAP